MLPQALFGCEVRNLKPLDLDPLLKTGKAAIIHKFPLRLNDWCAHEVAMGPPLGESAIKEPI